MKRSSSSSADQGVLHQSVSGLTAIAVVALDAARQRVQSLDDAISDAEAWQHRRAAKSAIDRARYRLGAAFEPGGRLGEIDDLVLTGLDVLGATALVLLGALMLQHPGDTLSDAICRLQRTTAGRAVRASGVWTRRVWLSAEYTHVVVAFEASQAGRDPKAAWRSHKPTVRQQYLVLELSDMLQVEQPVLATKGQAHDWLKRAGGRFDILKPPPMPPLPRIEDLAA